MATDSLTVATTIVLWIIHLADDGSRSQYYMPTRFDIIVILACSSVKTERHGYTWCAMTSMDEDASTETGLVLRAPVEFRGNTNG